MIYLISGFIIIAGAFIVLYAINEDKFGITFLCTLSIGIGALCISKGLRITTPQAIDVYRGKTTLQITYKDSIPVDTVVVFKEISLKNLI